MATFVKRRRWIGRRSGRWIWWPLVALFKLLGTIVGLTGRFVAMVIGLVFILVGALVSLTIIGAIVGIPLIFVGGMLVLKSIF
jgi:hypothetical protein